MINQPVYFNGSCVSWKGNNVAVACLDFLPGRRNKQCRFLPQKGTGRRFLPSEGKLDLRIVQGFTNITSALQLEQVLSASLSIGKFRWSVVNMAKLLPSEWKAALATYWTRWNAATSPQENDSQIFANIHSFTLHGIDEGVALPTHLFRHLARVFGAIPTSPTSLTSRTVRGFQPWVATLASSSGTARALLSSGRSTPFNEHGVAVNSGT